MTKPHGGLILRNPNTSNMNTQIVNLPPILCSQISIPYFLHKIKTEYLRIIACTNNTKHEFPKNRNIDNINTQNNENITNPVPQN